MGKTYKRIPYNRMKERQKDNKEYKEKKDKERMKDTETL